MRRWEVVQLGRKMTHMGCVSLLYHILQLPHQGRTETITNLSARFWAVFGKPVLGLPSSTIPGQLILVAAFDMFLRKHPGHECSKLRLGRIPSQWKDFNALRSVFRLTKGKQVESLGMLPQGLWLKQVQPEFVRMLKKPFGADFEPGGYFTYMSVLGKLDPEQERFRRFPKQ